MLWEDGVWEAPLWWRLSCPTAQSGASGIGAQPGWGLVVGVWWCAGRRAALGPVWRVGDKTRAEASSQDITPTFHLSHTSRGRHWCHSGKLKIEQWAEGGHRARSTGGRQAITGRERDGAGQRRGGGMGWPYCPELKIINLGPQMMCKDRKKQKNDPIHSRAP